MRTLAVSSLGLAAAGLLVASPASAVDPAETPRIMKEPGDVTDVVDAFDEDAGDPFDAAVSLTFRYLSKRARILRETSIFRPGLTTGGFTSKLMNVGQYVETTSELSPRLDIGLFEDLAVYSYVPIVLANSRRIEGLEGSEGRQDVALRGAPGERLFNLPFEAPDRSGPRYVGVGIDWGIFNQARDPTKPTWVFGVEGRISAGPPMYPCNKNPANGELECAHPGDIDRNGTRDGSETDPDGNSLESVAVDREGTEQSPGITRGTFGLQLHTVMSKRLKYIEPYGGIRALVEFAQGEDTLYGDTDLKGTVVSRPPTVGTALVGMMIHPWEDREDFGRLTVDLRFQGEYHSEGRDYSEMFDALGSSNARSLRRPRWSRYRDACPNADCDPKSVVDQGSEKSYFTGLSVVEAYGSYRASGSLTWRAGRYVKLTAGLGLRFDQAHGITHEQTCNNSFKDDPGAAGPCTQSGFVSGVPNPAFRETVHEPGRRFYVDESITYEVFARGVVMF